jgi:hypothetical protein
MIDYADGGLSVYPPSPSALFMRLTRARQASVADRKVLG